MGKKLSKHWPSGMKRQLAKLILTVLILSFYLKVQCASQDSESPSQTCCEERAGFSPFIF